MPHNKNVKGYVEFSSEKAAKAFLKSCSIEDYFIIKNCLFSKRQWTEEEAIELLKKRKII